MTTLLGVCLVALISVLLGMISRKLAEIPIMLFCGAAFEHGISELQDGKTAGGWVLIGCVLAYVASYIWRNWETLRQ